MTTNTGTVWLTVTPPEGLSRKQLAHAIAARLGTEVTYHGTPSFAYETGEVWLDAKWNIPLSGEKAERLIPLIRQAAQTVGARHTTPHDTEDTQMPGTSDTADEVPGLTISLPTTDWSEQTRTNLDALLASKGPLIARALDIPATPVEYTDDAVSFLWFNKMPEEDVRSAAIELIAALVKRAKEAARVSAKPPAGGNDKYTMRTFLLALGFIGADHAPTRRTLTKRLEGDAAWRTPRTEVTA